MSVDHWTTRINLAAALGIESYLRPSSARTSAAPASSVFILPRAATRDRGAIPQSVQGKRLSGATYCNAVRIRAATFSGVSDFFGTDVDYADHQVLPRASASTAGSTPEAAHSTEI